VCGPSQEGLSYSLGLDKIELSYSDGHKEPWLPELNENTNGLESDLCEKPDVLLGGRTLL
jgi:hypothetical protein